MLRVCRLTNRIYNDHYRASPAYQFESNEYRNKFYRHISEGGWPFSTSAHGWPISDCTSEGLKAAICLLKSKTVQDGLKDESLKNISAERLYKSVNVLLTYQNEDGGKNRDSATMALTLDIHVLSNNDFRYRVGYLRKQSRLGLV